MKHCLLHKHNVQYKNTNLTRLSIDTLNLLALFFITKLIFLKYR